MPSSRAERDRERVLTLLALLRLAVTMDGDGVISVVALRAVGAALEVTLRGADEVLGDVALALTDVAASVQDTLGLEVLALTAPGTRPSTALRDGDAASS